MWNLTGLAARDRSLITVAALVAGGAAAQLTFHLDHAKKNGYTETELVEAITHLAFLRRLAQGHHRCHRRAAGLQQLTPATSTRIPSIT